MDRTRKKVSKETEDLNNTANLKNLTDNCRTSVEIKVILKKCAAKKSPGPNNFTGKFYKIFNEELTKVLHKFFQNEKNTNSIYVIIILKPHKNISRKLYTSIYYVLYRKIHNKILTN